MNVNRLARLRWTRHKKRSGGWVCALSDGGIVAGTNLLMAGEERVLSSAVRKTR